MRCYKWCASRQCTSPVLFIVSMLSVNLQAIGVSVQIFADDTKLYSVFNNNMTPARLQLCLTAMV